MLSERSFTAEVRQRPSCANDALSKVFLSWTAASQTISDSRDLATKLQFADLGLAVLRNPSLCMASSHKCSLADPGIQAKSTSWKGHKAIMAPRISKR